MGNDFTYDVVVVGGGIAGLTSAAYASRSGCSTLLCEKGENLGGLVNSFRHNGFTFDGGIRAFENSGIVFPMLKQLGIELEVVRNPVSIGLEDDMVRLRDRESLSDYRELMCRKFPDNIEDIGRITAEIKKVMGYMDVLYGIDNPLFLEDYKTNREYLFKTLLPWLVKYKISMRKVKKLNEPINEYLKKFTANQALIDMITQHFFSNTPSFFALSYFGLYLDYSYPLGGTGILVEKMKDFITANKGEISTVTEVDFVDIEAKQVRTADGRVFGYRSLIWCADMGKLYSSVDVEKVMSKDLKDRIGEQINLISGNEGGDSIISLYISTDIEKGWFEKICGSHMFYTPETKGLSSRSPMAVRKGRQEMRKWIEGYLSLNTYEISCPVLRDSSLAPEGKTGLIVSTLMDYSLVKQVEDDGWYGEFKDLCSDTIISVLDKSIFPGLKDKTIDVICSTPLTIERLTGNRGGAITGWAFADHKLPAENRFETISKAVNTPLPDIYQAGQWSFSPSGLPISILTGKLAADAACSERISDDD
ncbi:MAG TPA: FAD-dependent oxidoreductase [Clostridiaceae bacterium]|nr:FAD-dependent oxidoreductase [Clostridiaceae bacterium]